MIDEKRWFLSVTACDENDKAALRWCVEKPNKRGSRKMRCPYFTDSMYEKLGWNKKCRYKVLGYKIEFEGIIYYVFDLNVKQVFNEKPKKGEEVYSENGEPLFVDTRKGYYPDDIANTFGIPMEQYRRETAVTDMDGFVTIAAFTGATEEVDPAACSEEITVPIAGSTVPKEHENQQQMLTVKTNCAIY